VRTDNATCAGLYGIERDDRIGEEIVAVAAHRAVIGAGFPIGQ
jgi:hypothetical protein